MRNMRVVRKQHPDKVSVFLIFVFRKKKTEVGERKRDREKERIGRKGEKKEKKM